LNGVKIRIAAGLFDGIRQMFFVINPTHVWECPTCRVHCVVHVLGFPLANALLKL